MGPKLSVVIPVFNAEEYLKECLNSILAQTLKDIEIICVDDGSTDSSYDILRKYAQKDKRIHLLHQENKHAGVARNYAVSVATGDYIHFMDADDFLCAPDVYERIFDLMDSFPSVNIVRFRGEAFDCGSQRKIDTKYYEAQRLEHNKIYDFEDVKVMHSFILSAPVVPWLGFVRREFIAQNHLEFNDLYSCNDRSFFISSVLLAGKVLTLDVFAVKHRINNPHSLVGSRDKHFDCNLKSIEIVQKFLKEHHFSDDVYKRVLSSEFSSPFFFFKSRFSKSRHKYEVYRQMRKFVFALDVRFYSPYIEKMWYFESLKKVKRTLWFSPKLGYKIMRQENLFNTLKRFVFSFEKKETKETLYMLGLPIYRVKKKYSQKKVYVLGVLIHKEKMG